ncbi:MAG: Proline/glycine betaine ABC-type transport system, permease component [Clostridia bacterium]|jgi:osmoprotectant transport system permease protein|nr:Proline/glycine betaine ABC-type transport system, permease component [Clostridia bacterium]
MLAFMTYAERYYGKLIGYFLDHFKICMLTMFFSILIAVPISLMLTKHRRLSKGVMAVLGAIYAIPSMALFAMLVPYMGLGTTTAIFVLVLYNQSILVRNTVAGFDSVDKMAVESAIGMGMSPWQVFTKVQLPIALPVILSGIRIAMIATIGSATIAATINAGGIGALLFDGLQTMNFVKMIWGTILAASFALIFNMILERLEKRTLLKARGEYIPRKAKNK